MTAFPAAIFGLRIWCIAVCSVTLTEPTKCSSPSAHTLLYKHTPAHITQHTNQATHPSVQSHTSAHYTAHQSGDTPHFCSQKTKIHFPAMTRERNLYIFMTSWTKPNRTATNAEGDRRLLVFVENPLRCQATGIPTNRRQNKSQSAWINQKRNSAPASMQAINPTLFSTCSIYLGRSTNSAQRGTAACGPQIINPTKWPT
jgi:hypothetical protein